MERKLATVLFVDLVDSTGFVAASDPEVVRRRVTRFFESAAHCIETHGGTVEKFAGDAVMAAFGVPRAHEDDAERAVRAALGVLESVHELGLAARIGIEAGEVVAEDGDSSFATGEAVNMAARLQQVAAAGEILVGPGAHRLASGGIEFEPAGERELRGLGKTVETWRPVSARDGGRPLSSLSAPLIGRDGELDLLENTFERTVRTGRPHLLTIFGEPGVGKSRLAREFVGSLEGATVLSGRCLPYGEGITYWPLAEIVKASAGITDDEPLDTAQEKLLECCEDEAVADLLGLAVGVLEAVGGERSPQEIAWAASEWAERVAAVQPLVLVFEDIHWAEEPLLDLIQHVASRVREAPILLLCLARPELLDIHSAWGGGSVRSISVELEPLARDESAELVEALLSDFELPDDMREPLLDKTEGNPLFVEETIRMLAEGDGDGAGIPDTLHALIAARIDRLPLHEKLVLQRAAVVGRVFWAGALAHLSPDVDDLDSTIDDLLAREFILREPRSTITGERAYRFKHVLIREVAYSGVSKLARAGQHARFAEWLRERAGEELLEIRAYHLDQAASLHAELDGGPPAELAREAAAALTKAGKRSLARESNRSARQLLLRAVELEPTLERRYQAARAAWRLGDFPSVSREMERVRAEAAAAGDGALEGRALTALAEVSLMRGGDAPAARELAAAAIEVLPAEDAEARFDVHMELAGIDWMVGDLAASKGHAKDALAVARTAERKDLESVASAQLAGIHAMRLELDAAEPLVARVAELAEESGSLVARANARRSVGVFHRVKGELDAAERALEDARALASEVGAVPLTALAQNWLGWVVWVRGDIARAEQLFRDSIKLLTPLEDRGTLCESQRGLAEVLAERGKLEEAERYALAARESVSPQDLTSVATTTMALGLVRAAQGRPAEAEQLLRDAVAVLDGTDFRALQLDPISALATFLRESGRADEAVAFEARLPSAPAGAWMGRADARLATAAA